MLRRGGPFDPKLCDPKPRFIAPLATDVNNPKHWVAGGEYVWNDTAAWKTVCQPPPSPTQRQDHAAGTMCMTRALVTPSPRLRSTGGDLCGLVWQLQHRWVDTVRAGIDTELRRNVAQDHRAQPAGR